MHKRIKVNIDNIILAHDNPRFGQDICSSQEETIFKLLNTPGFKIEELAKDIISESSLSPIDTIAVIKEGEKYKVIEGNRRVCVLKVIFNDFGQYNNTHPMINAIKFESKKIENINSLKDVEVCVFDHVEDAYKWTYKKHTNHEGSTVFWNGYAKKFFFEPDHIVFKFLEYAKNKKILNNNIEENIAFETINRALASTLVKNWIGIKSNKDKFSIKKGFFKNLKIFCMQLQNKKIKIAEHLQNNNTIKSLLTDFEKLAISSNIKVITQKEIESPTSKKTNEQINIKIFSDDLEKISKEKYPVYWELKKLKFNTTPIAATSLLRTLIEEVVRDFLKDSDDWYGDNTLTKKIESAIDKKSNSNIITDIPKKIKKEMKDIAYIHLLNQAIHQGVMIDKKTFKKLWSCTNKIISLLLKETKKVK